MTQMKPPPENPGRFKANLMHKQVIQTLWKAHFADGSAVMLASCDLIMVR
jgi:hypothetical protein